MGENPCISVFSGKDKRLHGLNNLQTSTAFWKFVRAALLPLLDSFEPTDKTIKVVVHPNNFSVLEKLGRLSFSEKNRTYEVYSTTKQTEGIVEIAVDKASCRFPFDTVLFEHD